MQKEEWSRHMTARVAVCHAPSVVYADGARCVQRHLSFEKGYICCRKQCHYRVFFELQLDLQISIFLRDCIRKNLWSAVCYYNTGMHVTNAVLYVLLSWAACTRTDRPGSVKSAFQAYIFCINWKLLFDINTVRERRHSMKLHQDYSIPGDSLVTPGEAGDIGRGHAILLSAVMQMMRLYSTLVFDVSHATRASENNSALSVEKYVFGDWMEVTKGHLERVRFHWIYGRCLRAWWTVDSNPSAQPVYSDAWRGRARGGCDQDYI